MPAPALAITIASAAAGVAPSTESGFLERLIATAFDPAWNAEHRVIIFAAIVGVLFLSGCALPLPEDIPLTLAGFTTATQAADPSALGQYVTTFMIVILPILLGDLVAWGLGRRYGLGLRERVGILRRAVTPRRLARVQRWFDRYGAFAVFLGRQVAGVRFVSFFTAGAMRVPVLTFLAFDFLGCAVSVPVWLTLGALAASYGKAWLEAATSRAGHTILLVAVVAIVVLVIVSRLRSARDAAAAEQADQAR